jgi:hypothetical protein
MDSNSGGQKNQQKKKKPLFDSILLFDCNNGA